MNIGNWRLGAAIVAAALAARATGQGVTVERIVSEGDPAPDGGVFIRASSPVMNRLGQVVFYAETSVSSTAFGLWEDGVLTLPAKHDDPAPDTAPGVYWDEVANRGLVLADDGTLALVGTLWGTGVDTSNNMGVWMGRPGEFRLIAREGDRAPGTPDDVVFNDLRIRPMINSRGRFAMTTSVSGPGVEAGNHLGIWTGTSAETLSLVARMGDEAPGTGRTFAVVCQPGIDEDGRLVFVACTDAATYVRDSLWEYRPGAGLSRLVAAGDHAPGTPDGHVFAEFYDEPFIYLTARGVLAFHARIEGPGVTPENNLGLWLSMPAGITLVARRGDAAPGFGPEWVYGGQPWASALNDLGQVLFTSGLVNTSTHDGTSAMWVATGDERSLLARRGDAVQGIDDRYRLANFHHNHGAISALGYVVFGSQFELAGGIGGEPGVLGWTPADGVFTIATEADELEVAPGHTERVVRAFCASRDAAREETPSTSLNGDGRTTFGAHLRRGGLGEHYGVYTAQFDAFRSKGDCPPDCNLDGKLNINDFICMQAKWRARDPYGDYDGSGTYTVNDFIRFQGDFVKGCP